MAFQILIPKKPFRNLLFINAPYHYAYIQGGDLGGNRNLQRLLMILYFPNICIRNDLIGVVVWHLAPSRTDVTVESAPLTHKNGMTFLRTNAGKSCIFTVAFFHLFTEYCISKKKSYRKKALCINSPNTLMK